MTKNGRPWESCAITVCAMSGNGPPIDETRSLVSSEVDRGASVIVVASVHRPTDGDPRDLLRCGARRRRSRNALRRRRSDDHEPITPSDRLVGPLAIVEQEQDAGRLACRGHRRGRRAPHGVAARTRGDAGPPRCRRQQAIEGRQDGSQLPRPRASERRGGRRSAGPRQRRPGSTRRALRASRTDGALRARAPPPGTPGATVLGAERDLVQESSSSRRPTPPPADEAPPDPGRLARRGPRSG